MRFECVKIQWLVLDNLMPGTLPTGGGREGSSQDRAEAYVSEKLAEEDVGQGTAEEHEALVIRNGCLRRGVKG